MMREAIEFHFEGLRAEGQSVPAPHSYATFVEVGGVADRRLADGGFVIARSAERSGGAEAISPAVPASTAPCRSRVQTG